MRHRLIFGPLDAPLLELGDGDIEAVTGVLASSLSGQEMAADELWGRVASDQIAALPYYTPVRYYFEGQIVGKFFLSRVPPGAGLREFSALSALGVLGKQQHTGGMYTGQRFDTVVRGIVGDSFSVSIDPQLATLPVYGWLPYQSRRENLHQAAFVMGATITRDEDGDMVIGFPKAAGAEELPDNKIVQGGRVVVDEAPATRTEITEHSFLALEDDTLVTLFDNTDGSTSGGENRVTFREAPVHSLTTSGTLEILESNCNYAVVTGVGVLTGKRYTHTTRVVAAETAMTVLEENTVTVKNRYLVNLANSRNVADRLLAYHSTKRTITNALVLEGHRPGDWLSLNDPYGNPTSAFLAAADFVASTYIKASCELIAGYTPRHFGNNFSQVIVLTGSGTWTPPSGITKGLVVLIGAGHGGGNGLPGKPGQPGTSKANGAGGEGGEPGVGGLSGRVLTVEMAFSGSYAYSCGVGGAPAPAGDTATLGSPGGDTTFGTLSSTNGQRTPTGIANLFTGELLAGDGVDGVPGGRGSQAPAVLIGNTVVLEGGVPGPEITHEGKTYRPGEDGVSATYAFNAAGPGAGGGAAVGADGEDGTDGIAINFDDTIGPNSNMITRGGTGGKGADATAPEAETTPGKGGRGGHGGAGGGCGGGAGFISVGYGIFEPGEGGEGGAGSAGSKGGDGMILIYCAQATDTKAYSITNRLTNAASSNAASVAMEGSSYTATISPYSGYVMQSITVTMGGVDVSSDVVSGNTVHISAVTGDVIVTAVAVAEAVKYTVTNKLTNATTSNSAVSIAEGSAYSATITAKTGYTLESIKVTMGGVDVTSSVVSGNTVSISAVTGNLIITATAIQSAAGTHEVTYDLYNVETDNRETTVSDGAPYSVELWAAVAHAFDFRSVYVEMGGMDITDSVVTPNNYGDGVFIKIPNVTGDVTIFAEAIIVNRAVPPR